jgi:hypothetical protein
MGGYDASESSPKTDLNLIHINKYFVDEHGN